MCQLVGFYCLGAPCLSIEQHNGLSSQTMACGAALLAYRGGDRGDGIAGLGRLVAHVCPDLGKSPTSHLQHQRTSARFIL